MTKEQLHNNYPPRLAEELDRLKAIGGGLEDPLNILVATLMYLNFDVEGFGERNIDQWEGGRGRGPFVWLWSDEYRQRRHELFSSLDRTEDSNKNRSQSIKRIRQELTEANLRDRAHLLNLLGEFYQDRLVPIDIRLIVSDLKNGSSLLKSQGSDVMALPENEPGLAVWIEKARAEMSDFAMFLVRKVREGQQPIGPTQVLNKGAIKKSDELWDKIYDDIHAPRELLVAYIRELSNEAKQLSLNERESRGDYSDENKKFPQTRGEEIATSINYALSMQDWINYETADDLEEIGEITGSLEISPDDHKLWRELFKKVDNLQD